MQRVRRSIVGVSLVAGVLVLGLVGPASAHKATLEVTGQKAENGKVSAVAYLTPPHGNTPIKFILKKKNDKGDWVKIGSKSESQQFSDGVYVVYFSAVKGDKRCKVTGIFEKSGHDTVKDTSEVFDC